MLDLPRQAGRGRGADGGQLFAGAVGAQGGIHPDLPGAAGVGQGRGGLRSRVIVIPGREGGSVTHRGYGFGLCAKGAPGMTGESVDTSDASLKTD